MASEATGRRDSPAVWAIEQIEGYITSHSGEGTLSRPSRTPWRWQTMLSISRAAKTGHSRACQRQLSRVSWLTSAFLPPTWETVAGYLITPSEIRIWREIIRWLQNWSPQAASLLKKRENTRIDTWLPERLALRPARTWSLVLFMEPGRLRAALHRRADWCNRRSNDLRGDFRQGQGTEKQMRTAHWARTREGGLDNITVLLAEQTWNPAEPPEKTTYVHLAGP